MSYIKLNCNKIKSSSAKVEFPLESDLPLQHEVIQSKERIDRYNIVKNGELKATVGSGGYFMLEGNTLERSPGMGWEFRDFKNGTLKLTTDLDVCLAGKKVGRITCSEGLLSWLYKIFIEFEFVPFRTWFKITFDKNFISEVDATCILLIYYSYCFD